MVRQNGDLGDGLGSATSAEDDAAVRIFGAVLLEELGLLLRRVSGSDLGWLCEAMLTLIEALGGSDGAEPGAE